MTFSVFKPGYDQSSQEPTERRRESRQLSSVGVVFHLKTSRKPFQPIFIRTIKHFLSVLYSFGSSAGKMQQNTK